MNGNSIYLLGDHFKTEKFSTSTNSVQNNNNNQHSMYNYQPTTIILQNINSQVTIVKTEEGKEQQENVLKEISFPHKIKQISCGASHTFLLTIYNEIYCFGNNDCGQLGLGNYQSQSNLVNLFEYLQQNSFVKRDRYLKIKKIKCGNKHSLIWTVDNTIYVCGKNDLGQLGICNFLNINYFTKLNNFINITIPRETIKKVICEKNNLAIITKDGQLYCCGSNNNRQLCLGPIYQSQNICQLTLIENLPPIKDIKFSQSHSIIITMENEIYISKSYYTYNVNQSSNTTANHLFNFSHLQGNVYNLKNTNNLNNNLKNLNPYYEKLNLKNIKKIYCGYDCFIALNNFNELFYCDLKNTKFILPKNIVMKDFIKDYRFTIIITKENKFFGKGQLLNYKLNSFEEILIENKFINMAVSGFCHVIFYCKNKETEEQELFYTKLFEKVKQCNNLLYLFTQQYQDITINLSTN
ncbi:hypothetical protein ABK040_011349 [Willaertia magna]